MKEAIPGESAPILRFKRIMLNYRKQNQSKQEKSGIKFENHQPEENEHCFLTKFFIKTQIQNSQSAIQIEGEHDGFIKVHSNEFQIKNTFFERYKTLMNKKAIVSKANSSMNTPKKTPTYEDQSEYEEGSFSKTPSIKIVYHPKIQTFFDKVIDQIHALNHEKMKTEPSIVKRRQKIQVHPNKSQKISKMQSQHSKSPQNELRENKPRMIKLHPSKTLS